MGSHKVERDVTNKRFQQVVKASIACLGSFLISMVGGLVLAWWEFKHHPTNSQLWMVPFGLILFITPVIVWFSIFISDFCNCREARISCGKEPDISEEKSVCERDDPTSFHVISL